MSVSNDAFVYLGGQLTRRRDHQHTHRSTAVLRWGFICQALQYRQREAGGFTGAGLRATHQVAAFEHQRNRLGLNGGWRVVTFFGDGTDQLGSEAKLIE